MICNIGGCAGVHHARGLCQRHYRRWKKHGDPMAFHPQATRHCTFEGCDRPHEAQGLCHGHRAQRLRGAELAPLRMLILGSSEERFEAYIDRSGSCWEWRGAVSDNGYGRMRHNDGTFSVHRFAYERYRGPIPKDLVIDHLCRNRRCANPDHLEAVTQEENIRRGLDARAVESCGQVYRQDEGESDGA